MTKPKLPKGVYKDRGIYRYKAYLGRENGKIKWGKSIRLCSVNATMSELWREFERVQGRSTDTLHWLLTTYNSSPQFKDLAVSTQVGYEGYLTVICNRKIKTGTFGDVELRAITKRTIRKYLDSYDSPVTANRHIQYLKAAWNWATQRYENVPEKNPCMGVTLNKEVPRHRYVTMDEYALVYDAALSMRVPYFAYAMELAYLCRARRGEIFSLTESDIMNKGLYLERAKGSKDEVTLWTARLRAAVNGCKTIYPDAPVPIKGALLLHSKTGRPFRKNALDSAWQRVMAKAKKMAKETGIELEHFTFHDLKARGITEHKDKHGGHKSRKMQAVYDRLPDYIAATR